MSNPGNPQQLLRALTPQKEFFVGIDSDGCVFDTMEIKQKECFCPNFIRHFGLQRVSRYARETWEFVNLYSKHRGANRFVALLEAFRLLEGRREIGARRVALPDLSPVAQWVAHETQLGNPALERFAAQANNPMIDLTLRWSQQVNRDIEAMVHGIGPFPFFEESLQQLVQRADALVVSQTPVEALQREWAESQIDGYVRLIAGQEHGTKTEHLALAAKGKYPDHQILMIGDAPGDLKAAQANGVLFFPINPGHEEDSWRLFHSEALDRFLNGAYLGSYQDRLTEQFLALLPDKPSW